MAQQDFILSGTLPTAQDGSALSGAELTLLGYAVDRFAAAGSTPYLVDNSATLAADNAHITVTDDVVTVSSSTDRLADTDTHYVIINKSIRVASGGSLRMPAAQGTHLTLVNCTIGQDGGTGATHRWLVGVSGGATDSAAGTGRSRDVSIATGSANTSTLNLYGCKVNGAASAAFQNSVQPADAIFSDFVIPGNQSLFGRTNGGRISNVDMSNKGNIYSMSAYGNYDLFSGVGLDSAVWAMNSDSNQDIPLLDRPNFTNDNQDIFYEFNTVVANDTQRRNLPIQIIAGPVLESANNVWGAANGASNTPMIQLGGGGTGANATGAGLMQYWGFGNSYFSDAELTTPVQGVKLKVTSSVNQGRIAAANPTLANNDWGVTGGFGQDASDTVICDYVTDTDGLLSSDNYQVGTGGTVTNGYIDWMVWGTYTDQGETILGVNRSGGATPAGMVVAPIEQSWPANYTNAAGDKEYQRYPISYELRSFTHDAYVASTTVPTYSADETQVTEASQTHTNTLVGVSVKASNVAANNSPSITWNTFDEPSINDIRDRFRGGWYNYDYDLANGDHLSHAINLSLGGDGSLDYSANATNIFANCEGVHLDGNTDLFTEDTFASINFNGGSVDGHTLTSTGNATNLGAVNNATITGNNISIPSATRTRQNSTLIFNTLTNNIDLDTFSSNMVFGRRSGSTPATIRFQGITGAPTVTTDQLLGTGWSVVNPGEVQLIADSASSFTVTVDQDDVDNLVILDGGNPLAEGGSVTVQNITYNFPAEQFEVRPAGNLDDVDGVPGIRTRGGYFQIQDSDGNDILPRVEITSATTLNDVTVTKGSDNTDAWVAYYKPATGWGSGRTAYNFTIDPIGQLTENHQVQPSEIANVLVENSTTDPGSVLGSAYTFAGSKLFIHISAPGNSLNSAESQAISLEAANSEAYFHVHVFGQRTTQLFEPGINNGSTWLTATDVQFESGKTNDPQQIVSQVTGGLPDGALLTPDAAGYNEVININEASASIPQIQAAFGDSLTDVKSNQAVLLTATQRGAVKSATYSAGTLIP